MSEAANVRPHVPGHQLAHVLGEGASSVVWAATDPVGRPVAVKVPRARSDESQHRQAELERHVLTAVRHDHLVPLRDVVHLDDGRVALVFDLVRGASVRALVRARGHLRPGETVTLLTPVCEAVAALHAAGGTHCDITPGNVLVTEDGRPLLADLGAARLAGSGPDEVLGTEGFVAPEVLAGDPPTEASDVYALGALAWHCLAGYGAPQTPIRLDLETVRSHVGPELADVVAACIDPDPARRPVSSDVGRRFFAAAPAEPVEVVVAPDEASALTQRLRREAAEQPARPPRRSGWLPRRTAFLAAGAVVGLTALLLLGWSLAPRWRSGPAAPTAATPSGTARSAPPAATPAGVADVMTDPAAPRLDPRGLLQALADRRARVLTTRDAAALTTVHEAGSAVLREDEQVLRTLTAHAQSYAGLRLSVAQARAVSATPTRAVLRARVDVAAYGVVSAGRRTGRPGQRGRELDFTVVRGAAGWRLASVTAPPAT